MSAENPKIVLKLRRRKDRRVRQGHPWVFSNEVETWPKGIEPGATVEVHDAKGRFLGRGYANKGTLIAVRLMTRRKKEVVNEDLVRERIQAAVAARSPYLDDGTDSVRLVFGEADGLPGLVVDRYGTVLAMQLLTRGIERYREVILDTLRETLAPRAIVDRCDCRGRALEGLPTNTKGVVHGDLEGPVQIIQDGRLFLVDVLDGQKTGFFLDQRANRQKLRLYVRGRSVLDVFSYTGAAAVYALGFGATHVDGIDSSLPALEMAEENLARNSLPAAEWHKGDAFDVLRSIQEEGRTFGCVLLDPPPFAPSRKDRDEALLAHTRLHKLALRVLEPGGFLVTSTCSHHVGAEELGRTAAHAALQSGRHLRQLERVGAFPDHPSFPGMPESEYLHTLYLQG